MKRLKLDVETLSVTSFPTAPPAEVRGTVQAHEGTTPGCVDSGFCSQELECEITSGINSCWCSEIHTCLDCPVTE